MIKNLTIFSSAFAAVLLLAASTQSFAVNYTISFTASGDTTAVGSVQVQNITKGTSITLSQGSLNVNLVSTAVDQLNADNSGISISQQASIGKSTLTFYAKQAGVAAVEVYAVDGKKILGQSIKFEFGENSIELSLATGSYVVQISGKGYEYSTKLQSQAGFPLQAELKLLGSIKNIASAPQKSKMVGTTTPTLDYSTGDKIRYTATVGSTGTYKSVVNDVLTGSKTVNFIYIATCNIPGGTFTMGSPSTEVDRGADEVQHSVTLSPFRMSKYEITNTQFADFLNTVGADEFGYWDKAPTYSSKILLSGSIAPNDFGLQYVGTKWVPVAGYEKAPIIFVSWYGAYEYCAYVGGRLPTEAEEEYAIRAGTTTPFGTGAFLTNLQANYDWTLAYNGNLISVPILNKTVPIGSYAPNAWGLYDIHGNIAPWCSDWYGPYPTTAVTDPTGAATGTLRTIRGGNYLRSAAKTRSAYRNSASPEFLGRATGIQVVFEP